MKPRYLGNQASQIKNYYGTLLGSYGRSFRIRHEKVRAALSGGGLTMTSYPACNKTSFSLKPYISDKSYYRSLSKSHGRSFRIRHEKLRAAPPVGRLTMTSYPVSNKTSLPWKPFIADKSYYGTL